MALDDFAPRGTRTVPRTSVAPEDEDLFDFPVIEMVLEAEKPVEHRAVVDATPPPSPSAQAPAPSAVTAPSAKPAAPKASAQTQATPSGAARAAAPAAKAVKPAADSRPAAQSSANQVEQAAELIEGLETVLDEELEDSRLARSGGGSSTWTARSGSPAALLCGVLLLNLLTFGFFWYASTSFREGIQGLRDDLLAASRTNAVLQAGETTRDAQLPRVPDANQPAGTSSEHTPLEHGLPAGTRTRSSTESTPFQGRVTPRAGDEHASAGSGAESGSPTGRSALAQPLTGFEETTLGLAKQEIEAGEVLAARKRLYRLLALADRIDTELRADVEARARFLVAESYRSQAEAKEQKHAEDAAAGRQKSPENTRPAPAQLGKEH